MTVIPINFQAAVIRDNAEWVDQLKSDLLDNKVAALVVRGVKENGELFAFTVEPNGGGQAELLRMVVVGQLHEAISALAYGDSAED